MYLDYASQARREEDELTLRFFTDFIDMQVTEIQEFELIMAKVRAYNVVPGLFYHLDHELRKW